MDNYMKLEIAAISENENFARNAVAAFALTLNPSLAEISDIKTAVSEAVTNCIVHAYEKKRTKLIENKILLECYVKKFEEASLFTEGEQGVLHIKITDYGCGIEDTEKAVLPFYTTLSGDERSGMGFTIMQTFMDEFSLRSERGKGTEISMSKKIGTSEITGMGTRVNAG